MNNNPDVHITFLGAAGTVTGSKHLLQTPGLNILVDCGLFQGIKPLREMNWDQFSFPPQAINFVILTHAHLDHCGYLPALVKQGFKGSIIMTPPTAELAKLILLDSANLQEEDAKHAKENGYSKHENPLPLYTQEDVHHTLGHFQYQNDEEWIVLSSDIRFRFRRNGHILGSCFVEMDCYGRRIVFSGDLGRQNSVLFPPPLEPDRADFLLIESTYGNRLHSKTPAIDQLGDVINECMNRDGNLLIPSFAVGRAQELMVLIHELKKSHRIPNVPVYLDTPMGEQATTILEHFPQWHKLDPKGCNAIFEEVKMVKKLEDTFNLIKNKERKIVIAASGMLTGGRVLHYLKDYINHERNTILLVGYQAEGTRGRALHEGTHELKMHGKYFDVRAQVRELDTLSGHADQSELMKWVGAIRNKPERIFIVHGESDAAYAFSNKIKHVFGYNTLIPSLRQDVVLFDSSKPFSGNTSGN